MANTNWWLGLGVAGALLACDGGTAADDTSDGADGADAADATSRDTTDADTGHDAVEGPPSIASITAHTAGAKGIDLVVSIVGSDADGDAELARVRLFDADQRPVLAFRTGLGERPDSNEQLVALNGVDGEDSFITEVRLGGVIDEYPNIASVEVALRDSTGAFSDDVRGAVSAQAIRALGDACDAAIVADRCSAGLGCRGTPAQCQEGLAPEVAKVAYLQGEGGTRILVQGVDPEEDVASVLIEFLDASGHALMVDLDNDEVAESSEFEVAAESLGAGAFSVHVVPVAGFEAMVPSIAVTATDAAGHTGVRKTAKLAATPIRSVGQACDLAGFDACNPATAACVPNVSATVVNAGTCKAKSQLAKSECALAPELVPGAAPIVGVTAGPSLWDAPMTCSSGDPKGRPEGVAVLHLSAPASRLTLTTALAGTNFDSVVYLLPGCGDTTAAPLGCADDAPSGGAAATLELTLLPAGDYLVVVDSWGAVGGSFALSATVE